MNADDLRTIQAPLKARYRASPEAAGITLSAEGRLGAGVSCKVETGKALVVAGLHPGTGGDGMAACSGDMLLEALVACAGVTLSAVATTLGIELRDAMIRAEGDLDFRGTLGLAKDVPVGFQQIRLEITLDTDAPEDQLATLLRLTERYCVVYQTLAHPSTLAVTRRGAPAQVGSGVPTRPSGTSAAPSQATNLYPFVPSGPSFSTALAFLAELGFEKAWAQDGLAGMRFAGAYFILQDIDIPEWQRNQMIAFEVTDLDAYWAELHAKDLARAFEGVRLLPPTEFPWGREVHIVDPGGVCWHVRQSAGR